jgi:hypothetical protein
MEWISPSILISSLKYTIVYTASLKFNTPAFKNEHPDAWKFFTNDPTSIGFHSAVALVILFMFTLVLMAALGSTI